MNQFEKHGKGHPTTFCRRFGSWPKALELANLKPSRSEINISDEKLFINLQNLWLSLKRQPTYTETRKPLSKYSARTYENRFGSWSNALVEFVEWTKLDPRERGDYDDDSNNAIQLTNERTTKRTSRQISERQRFRILLNAGFRCQSCGQSPVTTPGIELHVDHIIPWSKGGETTDDNLTCKCKRCNIGKGNAFEG